MEGYHGEIMNKRQAKKKRDKLIIARLKKRNDKKIWGMLKKNFGNCEKLRSLTIYNQRKKNRSYYTEKWEEENLYEECRNCRHEYSALECELCVDFDMYEGTIYGK